MLTTAHIARRLRNHKEFGGAWTDNVKNVKIPGLRASALLQQRQQQQQQAAESTNKDDDFLQNLRTYPDYTPKLRPSVSPLNDFARPGPSSDHKPPAIFTSLDKFLAPRPIRPPTKRTYVFDPSTPPALRKKLKKQVASRNKRGEERYAEQIEVQDSCKKIAREKKAKTLQLARYLGQSIPEKGRKDEEMGKTKKSGSWTGPQVGYDGHEYTLDELIGMGFDEFEWDGQSTVIFRDENGIPVFVLGGFPDTTKWPAVVEKIQHLLAKLQGLLRFARSRSHRRGTYATISLGISFGGGQTQPGNFDQSPHNVSLLNELRMDTSVQQVARYMDHLMSSYFPRLHALYSNILHQLRVDNSELEVTFEQCCFAALNVNFGSAVTLRHTDYLNLLFGQCAVFPVGDYDYTKGGHLVLWDLKLAIQFPPGSVILLPSALLEHCNASISAAETRSSITFYSASGLFRWVTNGYMSDKEFLSRCTQQMRNRWESYRDDLWSVGVDILRDDI
ncbi:hypothetical protein PQX77_000592 [Marasmius sp. AFHP31]|nr:hypothetical protein PQX77_000592 [Marasmius sp. AFHP31]